MQKKRSTIETRDAYVMLLPTLIGLVVFSFGATFGAIALSFTNYSIKWPPQFVGITNYVNFFGNKLFGQIISNTALYIAITVIPCAVFSFLLALLINRPMKGINLFRTAYFWPVLISMTAAALVWRFLLNPQFGLVNYLLSKIGVKGPRWFSSTQWALIGVAIIFVWKSVGYYMIILLAGLQNIPQELYESAMLDGAGALQRTRYITLPMISPTLFFVMIMLCIGAFQVFDPILVISPTGGPANATTTLSFYVYQNAFTFLKMGYASSVAVVLFILVLAVSAIQFALQDRWVFYE